MDENHSICVESRKRAQITGVKEVESFSETKIITTLNSGIRLTFLGSNIKISAFQKAEGVLKIDGEFTEIKYGANSQGIKNLFK